MDIKEQIAEIILNYQNDITAYFEAEVPMEDDAANIDNKLQQMKEEILSLFR